MRNLEKNITQVQGTTVAIVHGGKTKERSKAYLKAFAKYLEATLPDQIKYYSIKTTKTIRAEGGVNGGAIAVRDNLIDEMTITIMFNETIEEFKKRKEVTIIVNEAHPINFFRRLKKSNDVRGYLELLKRKFNLTKDGTTPELDDKKDEIIKLFDFLFLCLEKGIVPLLNAKK
jgi:hypothetical protein